MTATISKIRPPSEITSSHDMIDSRDVIERIAYLEQELDYDPDAFAPDLREELTALTRLAEQGAHDVADWKYGETLIRSSYFETYAREMVEDCGYIARDFPEWIEIDWRATARHMLQDYVELTFDGVTYYAR